jgi:Mg2+ and Co2+ transporter CorA
LVTEESSGGIISNVTRLLLRHLSNAEGLVNRIQLLQNAAAGIINVAQNEVMKILIIASVAGIPPVLIAGIYGMNFKNMPAELGVGMSLCFGLECSQHSCR